MRQEEEEEREQERTVLTFHNKPILSIMSQFPGE
jgi:hypothetical protein